MVEIIESVMFSFIKVLWWLGLVNNIKIDFWVEVLEVYILGVLDLYS